MISLNRTPIRSGQRGIINLLQIIFFIISFAIGYFAVQFVFNQESPQDVVTNMFKSFRGESEWVEFNSTAGQFKVKMPLYPTTEVEKITIPETDITLDYTYYVSEVREDLAYLVGFTHYPTDLVTGNESIDEQKQLLNDSINGAVTSDEGNSLKKSMYCTFGKYNCIDYEIENTKKDLTLKGKNILVKSTLYTLIISSESIDIENYNKFVDSFQLLE